MKKLFILISAISMVFSSCESNLQVLWNIGEKDGTSSGLALYPDGYNEFLPKDYGWEDKFFMVGVSDPAKDFPYVLPGVRDEWAGAGYWSGLRSHVNNILFDVADKGNGDWKLAVDVLDASWQLQPVMEITTNGIPYKFILNKGVNDNSLKGTFDSNVPTIIEIPIKSKDIVEGFNEIKITIIEGSWAVFDDVRMLAPQGARLSSAPEGAFIRSVNPASYTVNDGAAQPLLVEVQHLDGEPQLSVELDGKEIFTAAVETGAYIFEAPMPAVSAKTKSFYTIKLDGKTVREGKVLRSPQEEVTSADYVDTRLGSAHSRWMLAPGPWMPFSMVKLSPDNQEGKWQAGYDPTIESITMFSHIHEWTFCGLGTLPVTGPLKIKQGSSLEVEGHADGYRSAFDKRSEICDLGYYAVHLTDYDILAELTSTTRCGFQRYTYPKGQTGRVMIDFKIPAEYPIDILGGEVKKVSDRRIEGWCHQFSEDVWGDQTDQDYIVHFVAEFDCDIKSFGGWHDEEIWIGDEQECGPSDLFGCYAEFAPHPGNVVQMRTSISYVSVDGASKNLEEEVTNLFGWDFEAVRKANVDTWNDIFDRAVITTDNALEKKRFYTNFYRSICSRNIFNDVDGQWVDCYGKVQKLTDPDAYALGCDAFWNTFWNLNQSWNLLTPEWSSRWVKSQLAMYDTNGWLAKGPAGMNYVPVMVAEHEIAQMVGAYQMGIRDFDEQKVFEAIKKMQTTPAQKVGNGLAGNIDLVPYLKHHYVPCDLGTFSNSMEYSYDDWVVSQMALALGKTADYDYFAQRGTWWKNAVNREDGYCHRRLSNGRWEPDFNPMREEGYTEGNPWQLTHFVPQDIPGLADWVGRDRYIQRLLEGFEVSDKVRFNSPNDDFPRYPIAHANQQSMHLSFIFNYLGMPWESQKWCRRILERYYGYGISNAWLGDEDQGQMSAWLIMASLGLFQIEGGCSVEPTYEILSPLYEKAVIDLGGRYGRGDKFTIIAHDASRKNKYIQAAKLNGREINTFLIPASEVLKGGELELWLGPEPNRNWGTSVHPHI